MSPPIDRPTMLHSPPPADREAVLASVKRAIAIERDALTRLLDRVGPSAVEAVESLLACRGRVIVTGMGKTGLIGRKLAATLCSTGTPAFFLHPAEAIHGDLGLIGEQDLVVAVSQSGETAELLAILAHLKRFDVPLIALTGRTGSTLARHADIVIDVSVEREADSLGLAPTASTTTALAMADALAVALLERRQFTRDQFAIFHPGGALGRKLLWRVRDLMHDGPAMPRVERATIVRDVICEMTSKKLGAAFVIEADGRLAGILTDGDLRRLFAARSNPLDRPVEEVMTNSARTVAVEALAAEALQIMESRQITVLPVVEEDGVVVGAVHLHDLIRAGLA